MRQSPAARNACSAMALSLPPLQQKSTSSGMCESLMARRVFHTDAKFTPQCRKSVGLFVLFVGEVVDAPVEAESVPDIVGGCEIDEGIAGINNLSGIVVIEALTGKITGNIPVHPPIVGVERNVSGVYRPAKQAAAHQIIRINIRDIGGCGQRARRIICVIRAAAQPAGDARFAGKIAAARARQIGIKKCAYSKRASGCGRAVNETDDVVEAA